MNLTPDQKSVIVNLVGGCVQNTPLVLKGLTGKRYLNCFKLDIWLGVYMQVYSVDNALVRVADPVFFGYTYESKADVGVKAVTKTSPEEAVGVLCLMKSLPEAVSENDSSESKDADEINDDDDEERTSVNHAINSSRYGVMEYSEMPSALRTAKCEDALVYKAAHICINIFSVDYLMKFADPKYELGFHAALKRIPSLLKDKSGNWETHIPDQPNGIKLEQFIFDAFQHCDPEKVSWSLCAIIMSSINLVEHGIFTSNVIQSLIQSLLEQ